TSLMELGMVSDRRINQQLRTVERLLQEYRQQPPNMPLARFLSGFYKRNRQMGGNDRRIASRLAYHYFRIGNAVRESAFIQRLAIAEFLCNNDSVVVQQHLP